MDAKSSDLSPVQFMSSLDCMMLLTYLYNGDWCGCFSGKTPGESAD